MSHSKKSTPTPTFSGSQKRSSTLSPHIWLLTFQKPFHWFLLTLIYKILTFGLYFYLCQCLSTLIPSFQCLAACWQIFLLPFPLYIPILLLLRWSEYDFLSCSWSEWFYNFWYYIGHSPSSPTIVYKSVPILPTLSSLTFSLWPIHFKIWWFFKCVRSFKPLQSLICCPFKFGLI